MSYQATSYVESLVLGITRSEKFVLGILASQHHAARGSVIISIPELASKCLLKERRIYVILAELEGKGFIRRISGGGRSIPSTYLIHGITNPAPQCRVSSQETLHFSALNPALQCTKPCTPVQQTLHSSAGANKERQEVPGTTRKEQEIKNPPTPLLQGGTRITKRDLQKLKTEILYARKNTSDGKCRLHPESGRTQWGTCWACYALEYGYQTERECALHPDAKLTANGECESCLIVPTGADLDHPLTQEYRSRIEEDLLRIHDRKDELFPVLPEELWAACKVLLLPFNAAFAALKLIEQNPVDSVVIDPQNKKRPRMEAEIA